jgi:L-iditol 2-dehydrogenase
VLVGLTDEASVPFDVLDIIDDELTVRGSFRYKNTYDAAVDLLADGVVDLEGLVDFTSSLSAVDAAFERALDPTVVKGVIAVGDA